MGMSRKHYREFAEIFADMSEDEAIIDAGEMRGVLAELIADVCSRDNSRFDRSKFLRVCKHPGFMPVEETSSAHI